MLTFREKFPRRLLRNFLITFGKNLKLMFVLDCIRLELKFLNLFVVKVDQTFFHNPRDDHLASWY